MDGSYRGAGAEASSDGYTMAGVVVERGGAAITVKMIGPAGHVASEFERFQALCASLRASDAPSMPPQDDAHASGFDPAALKWTAPEGWIAGPAKSMRIVTLTPKDRPGVECYVTVLSARGGGLEANVNRWRDQLGQPPLTADAIAKLDKVTVLGQEARFVEIDAGANGLLGLVCDVGTHTVFVKMTGPMEALRAERERFLAFCRSLS
jgi:hypothetical protein